jgi:hypothetical protein
MDRQQIGLKLAVDAMGLPFRLSSFEDRLILQKAVYLAQAAAVQLGYTFGWYLRGPYSPALTRDAFTVATQSDGEPAGWKLDVPSLERLKPLFGGNGRGILASRLELLASVLFLLRARRATAPKVAELREVLHKYGKTFSEDDIRRAIKDLTEHGLYQPTAAR